MNTFLKLERKIIYLWITHLVWVAAHLALSGGINLPVICNVLIYIVLLGNEIYRYNPTNNIIQ